MIDLKPRNNFIDKSDKNKLLISEKDAFYILIDQWLWKGKA